MAAYVRVSTDNDEQTSSYELQKNYYTEYITGHPGWELVGIYADEGISGTSIAHRKGMLQMIEDCKAGKIDLIMTKSIARFARNIVDCLSVIDLLKNLEPPVGVQFEADNIYTLDNNGRMILTILASVAEEESHCAPLVDMLVKTAHNIRYITNFRIRFFILFRLMSRRFIPFVVKLWSNDPDK